MNALAHIMQPSHAHPRVRKAPTARARPDHGSAQPGGNRRPLRAVIVDDSPFVLKTITSLLEEQTNVQIIGAATDGYGAVRRVRELHPDLVLMDLQLPGINGLEATRQIKARSQAPAVILVTADDTPRSREAARAAGTDGFVDKQHLFTQLRVAIQKLFRGSNRLGRCYENEDTI
jgi:DNA-binding NarL/FixJ family response regulator